MRGFGAGRLHRRHANGDLFPPLRARFRQAVYRVVPIYHDRRQGNGFRAPQRGRFESGRVYGRFQKLCGEQGFSDGYLHITKDGVLILLHDDTLDRTSDSAEVFGEEDVRPEDKTYEELRTLNMGAKFTAQDGSTPYKGLKGDDVPDDVRIQRVEEVLDYLQAHGDFQYIIEIKNGGDLGKQGVDILYNILKERDLLDDVIFGTFHGEVSKYVDEKYPDLMRSAGIAEVLQFYFASFLGIKLDVNYVALQIPYRLAGFNLGTARIINYAHSMDLAVQYWTINDPEDVKYLNSIGADCIMSDDPGMAYRAINGQNS